MKRFSAFIWTISAIILWSASCKDTTKVTDTTSSGADNSLQIGFYNVENIFDTDNDPKINDDDFTPTGKYQWTADRYRVKLDHTIDALLLMDSKFPDILGLCEIENRRVLEDLLSMERIKAAGYSIIHQDSPDERGIDVALLYKKDLFKVEKSTFYKVTLPSVEDPNTRDILYVKGKSNGEDLHIFVNHWPSRSGGQEKSEVNRITAASILKSKIDSILSKDANAKFLCMGDFNDHPDNKSITETLGARGDRTGSMFNLMASMHGNGSGSYWYKGEWGALDQVMVSFNWIDSNKGWTVNETGSARFVKDDVLMFKDNQGVARPNRTYAGDDYKGGYSDHLPAVVNFVWK